MKEFTNNSQQTTVFQILKTLKSSKLLRVILFLSGVAVTIQMLNFMLFNKYSNTILDNTANSNSSIT